MVQMIKRNKNGNGTRNNADVLFSVVKSGDGKSRQISIIFTKDAKKRVFKDSEYGIFGFKMTPNFERLYFSSSNVREGFKLSKRKDAENSMMRATIDQRMGGVVASNWIGYYDIAFDPNENMWYIELQQKKVEVK